MSETLNNNFLDTIKDAIGGDATDFIDPNAIKKDIGDSMKQDIDAELKKIEEDKDMNAIEKGFKKSLLKLKNSVLGKIFWRDKTEDKTEKSITPTQVESYKDVTNDPKLAELAKWPNIDYMQDPTFQMYLLNLEEKNGLPYHMMRQLMFAESAGTLYNKKGEIIQSKDSNGKMIAAGLFAFIPETAKTYIKKLNYEEKDYELIYTNPIIAAQASALLLKDRFAAGDTIVENLAHYNAGPGTIGGKKITADNFFDLPSETEKYVVKIGHNMLSDMGIDSKLSKVEQKNPNLIGKAKLETFLALVNKTPLTKDEIKHKETNPTGPEIAAKNMTEVTGFGDSGMQWLHMVWLENTQQYVGRTTEKLLKELDNTTVLENIKKGKSCILAMGYNDIPWDNRESKFEKNMRSIVDKINPTQCVLTTLYYNNDPQIPNTEVDKANSILKKIASEKSLPIIDVQQQAAISKADIDPNDTLKLHLSASGYKKIYNEIKEEVELKQAA